MTDVKYSEKYRYGVEYMKTSWKLNIFNYVKIKLIIIATL